MSKTNETCDDILRDMFQDHSTDNAAYRIRCYATRWQRALRRERERAAASPRQPKPSRGGNSVSEAISAAFL